MIYFHGNAEDIGLTYNLIDFLRNMLGIHILAAEFPGYGLYPGKANALQIIEDAETVFKFVENTLKIDTKNILIFGRSIGSGPATWLARNQNPGCLILMSAYTSIRAVVKNVAGRLAQYLVAERFKNIDCMPEILCPTFFLHGLKDKLIPYSHSQKMHELCNGLTYLHLPSEMDHNNFDIFEDLLIPLGSFLINAQIDVHSVNAGKNFISVPEEYFHIPTTQPNKKNKGRLNKFMRKFA
mmetsp:Transcript_4021/g.3833  ORF Transcript_4021/g.3833 Transcript_4021/m.3833 type:complete len:239 (+) Transcript_4021:139-855(+)